jgi:hypothetical protein
MSTNRPIHFVNRDIGAECGANYPATLRARGQLSMDSATVTCRRCLASLERRDAAGLEALGFPPAAIAAFNNRHED